MLYLLNDGLIELFLMILGDLYIEAAVLDEYI